VTGLLTARQTSTFGCCSVPVIWSTTDSLQVVTSRQSLACA